MKSGLGRRGSHRKVQIGFKVISKFSWLSPKMFSGVTKNCFIQSDRQIRCLGVTVAQNHFCFAFQDCSDSWLRVWLQGRCGGAAEERRWCQSHWQFGPWCISLRSPQQEPRPRCNFQNPLGRNHPRSILQDLNLCLLLFVPVDSQDYVFCKMH